jgi:diguanylate cyclase (GGDEF)-like protein/PAS domain S-box-containing protein
LGDWTKKTLNFLKSDNHAIQNLKRVAGIASLIIGLYALLFSWQSWREEKSNQLQEFATIMELGSKAIDAYLMQLQNGLLTLSAQLTEAGDPVDLDRAFILLKRFKEARPELINVTFISPEGQILLTAKTPPGLDHPSLAQQPSFMRYRDELQQGQAVSTGRPLIGMVSNLLIIPLRHSLRNPQGQVTAIVSINLSVELLQNFWKEAPITKKAALGLMRDDGFLISRYPVPDRLPPEEIYGKPRTGALIRTLQRENFPISGFVEGPSSLDGTDFLTAFRRLPHFPVTLFIAMPQSEIHAAWWKKVRWVYLWMSFLIIGGGLAYRFAVHRQRAWDRELHHVAATLRESEQRLQWVLEGSNDGFWDWNLATGHVLFSRRWVEMLGYSLEKIEPQISSWEKLVHPDDWPYCQAALQAHFAGETLLYQTEHRMRAKNGEWLWVLDRGKVMVRDAEGRPLRMAGTHTDITERKKMEEALQERASHDALTGLFNRRSLNEALPRELHRCRRNGEPLTVAMLDLDHFKHFNDAYGHEAGDLVLQAVGELLHRSLRASDMACRYGGEELTVVMPGFALDDARSRLDEVRQAIMGLRLRYRNDELPAITVSIGVAQAVDQETDAIALLGRADAALYQAKEQGRNRVVAMGD